MAKKQAFTPVYTAGDIMGLYQSRKDDNDEGRLRNLATQFRALTRLEHAVTIPAQYKAISREVRTPFVRDAWHRITSSLVAKRPVEHITPKDDARQDYRDSANTGERWGMALIERLCKETGRDIIFDSTAALVRDGESVLKVVHRPDAWANFPKRASDKESADDYKQSAANYKRGADLPIAWRVVDRLSIVYEGGEYGDDWVCEYGEYSKPYLRNKYAMQDGENGLLVSPATSLEGRPFPEGWQSSSSARSVKVEFWTDSEWHVLIDGSEAPGYPKRNPYAPYLPYFRAPAYDLESLLYSLLFLVPQLDSLLTMKLNWAYLGAYPSPVIETMPNQAGYPALEMPLGNPGDAAATQPPLTWSPGKVMDLGVGRRMTFLVPPPVGGDLNQLIQTFKSMIDIAGVPSVMRGMSGGGDSGYLANQMRAAAEMAYKQAALAGQRQLEKAMEFTHWLCSNVVKQTVYVLGWDSVNPKTGRPTEKAANAWLGLSPDSEGKNLANYKKMGPVNFQYRPTLPTDEQARAMIALQLTNAQKPLYDIRHALETWMQEEDPDSIMDALAVEQALNSEPLASMVREQALREAGLLPAQPPAPNPAQQLVGPNGQPLLAGGPMSPGMQGVPLANQAPPGMPGVPGLTMPLSPQAPQGGGGIPGAVGGRAPGMYPGLPSNQGQ
jgi:hypothetical protein